MSKYAVMTECRDFRQQDWARREQERMKKAKNLAIFMLCYVPVMTFFGGILILGFAPL